MAMNPENNKRIIYNQKDVVKQKTLLSVIYVSFRCLRIDRLFDPLKLLKETHTKIERYQQNLPAFSAYRSNRQLVYGPENFA